MKILVNTAQAENVANSLCSYLFKTIQEYADVAGDFKWLKGMHQISRDLKSIAELGTSGNETITVDIPKEYQWECARMIELYLVADIRASLDEDVEWLNEMMSIHAQLTASPKTATAGSQETAPVVPAMQQTTPSPEPQPVQQQTQTDSHEYRPQPQTGETRSTRYKKETGKTQPQGRKKEHAPQRAASKPAPSRWDHLADEDADDNEDDGDIILY